MTTDLTVFSENIEAPKKGRPRKNGGDLSTISKGQITTTALNFDDSSIQNITIISDTLGADFLPQLYQNLQARAASFKQMFDAAAKEEEATFVAMELNIERAKKLGREKGSRKMELRQLIKLKTKANSWMSEQKNPDFGKVADAEEYLPSEFESLILNYAAQNLPYNYIAATMVNHAKSLHIELLNFNIQKEGKWQYPEHKFIYEDKIAACKEALIKLGVELTELQELGIEIS